MKRTVLQMLRTSAEKYPKTAYTNQKGDSGWLGLTYPEVLHESRFLAAGLHQLGIEKGEKIAILAEGRNRWITGEFGILFAGGTTVPLSIKLMPDEVLFRLNHSESKAVIVSKNTFEKVASIWTQLEFTRKIIFLEDDLESIEKDCKEFGINTLKDIVRYTDVLQTGKHQFEEEEPYLNKIESELAEDEVVTISYTSGTTGDPKGIMLTQLNYFSNCTDAMGYFNIAERDRLYIILPLDHSFAHTVGIYAGLLRGLSLYFVDARGGGVQTLKNIPINLVECNPHFILTVPALSGNFMTKIKDGVAAKGKFVNGIFNAGLNAGIRINRDGFRKAGFFVRLINFIPYKLADALVFKKVRLIFGNSIRYCVGGGALLDIRQQVFFCSIGVPVYQGYGLSEATPIISANTPETHKMGSSGKVIPNVDCKILRADDSEADLGEKGEIVIRGNNVMKGYYKNPVSTAKTVKGDWLYTGDLGYYDKDGFLIVVGRGKALLISSDGEKYSPEGIEEAIQNSSELILQAMVYNDMKKYTTALVTLDAPKIARYVEKNKIADSEVLLKAIKLDFYKFKETAEYRNQFPEKWIPSTFQIVSEPFTEQNHMINSTMKMVRHKIQEAYHDKIEVMYTSEGSNAVNDINRQTVKKYLPFNQ
ncbi:MAG: AMP-dependent synthetase [Porphyromonadaceae bacterium]|nr:MAG: AMP-dependent synthetase [Porphyromonadaceae bacterium]